MYGCLTASKRLAVVRRSGCPPRAPTPAAKNIKSNRIPQYPPRRQINLDIHAPSWNMRVFIKDYSTLKRNVGLAEREILALMYKCNF
jgi:hypothetical protein